MTKQASGANTKLLTVLMIVIGLLFGGAFGLWYGNNQAPGQPAGDEVAGDQFRHEYPDVAADHRFVYASADQVMEVFEQGDGVVFLGFKECPWCQALAPRLDEAAKAENLERVYYLDIRQARQQNDDVYQQLLTVLEDYLETDEAGQPRIYVPDVSAVRGGEIIDRYTQETAPDGEALTPDGYWTEERSEQAVEQLRAMIRQLG